MHTETDHATYWQTMSRLTGHSTRYLKVRAWVRALVCVVPFTTAYAFALDLIK